MLLLLAWSHTGKAQLATRMPSFVESFLRIPLQFLERGFSVQYREKATHLGASVVESQSESPAGHKNSFFGQVFLSLENSPSILRNWFPTSIDTSAFVVGVESYREGPAGH